MTTATVITAAAAAGADGRTIDWGHRGDRGRWRQWAVSLGWVGCQWSIQLRHDFAVVLLRDARRSMLSE